MNSKVFSNNEILDLYRTKVHLPDDYFVKYENVPACPVRSWGHKWANHDFPRVWCVLDFIEWTRKHDISRGNLLAYTCETDPELEFLDYENHIHLPYPPHDLHTLSHDLHEIVDFFVFSQTIEHLYNPFACMEKIHRAIRRGGYVFTSVPTLNIPHLVPMHFNGYTPIGLPMLFRRAGFDVIETGQWGNYEYIQRLWGSHIWPGYEQLQRNNRVANERENACQCWILARKP